MTELQQLDNVPIQQDDGSENDQLDNEDFITEDNISGPDGIDRIPEKGPMAIDDCLSNIDGDMSEAY